MAKSKRIKEGIGYDIVQVLIYIFVGLFALLTVLPFLYIIAGSFATERELTERSFFIIPTEFSINAYKYIISTGEIFRWLKNSVYLTVVGTLVQMVFTTTFAYPLSKSDFRGRNFVLNMVIVTMVFGGGMIPSYLLIKGLGLTDKFAGLIIPGAIGAFNMVIVKNFFQEIPKELDEAAKLDGCSDFNIFLKIFLPLSKPVLASISLFYAVGHWNDYFGAMIYLNDPKKEVVQVALRRIVLLAAGIQADGTMLDYGIMGVPPDKAVKMAATVVATVPILLVYPFIQKYFTKGVMIGAVKG